MARNNLLVRKFQKQLTRFVLRWEIFCQTNLLKSILIYIGNVSLASNFSFAPLSNIPTTHVHKRVNVHSKLYSPYTPSVILGQR